jgi:hypothetical protein
LGVLRQFYTFRENEIISKTGAGEYALSHTPDRWQRIIREALNLREARQEIIYHSRFFRAVDAVAFLKYIIQTCNANLVQWQPAGKS